jgi:tetratricopeptide (TPR) repeat protein
MKLSQIILFFSLLIIFNCSSDLSYEQEVKNYNLYVKKSDSLFELNKYKEALIYINYAIEITDTVPTAIYLKGFANYKLNRLDDAEEDFSKAIELEGEKSKTYKDRAKVYLKMGDSDFLDDINVHLENYPNDEEALVLKRTYLENKEDYDEAINEYNIALNKSKNDVSLLTKRAELYFKNGDYQKSVQDYEQILQLNPVNEDVKLRIDEISSLMNNNSNRNIFIGILIACYLVYLAISFFILKPLVYKKAVNQIGGKFIVSKDPLIWIMPIFLISLFLVLYLSNFIPNFK